MEGTGPRSADHRRKRAERSSSEAAQPEPRPTPPVSQAADSAVPSVAMVRSSAADTVAASSALRRKAPKPNRQRCKEFRERRKTHVVELEERVGELRQEVSELVMKKSIYSSKVMLKRHHAHGSLEKLIREYFTLFRYGVAVERPLAAGAEVVPSKTSAFKKAQLQVEFLYRIIDPETVYGDHKGPAGCVAQWGYYTAAYASFVGEVNRVSISGTEEDPILYCFTTYHVILSRNTIKYLFPHAIHNEGLVQRMIGLYVPCPVVGIFQFTMDGHISSETANIELADALLSAGCRVEDVAEVMQGFVISDKGQVPDSLQAEDHHFMEEIGIDLDGNPIAKGHGDDDTDTDADAEAKEKLRISFLVDNGDDDEEEKEKAPNEGN